MQIPVELPSVMGSYGIVTRRDRPVTPGAEAFLKHLKIAMTNRKAALGG